MQAAPGDRLLVKGHHVGEHDRDGRVVEVHGKDGAPPYLVEWSDSGHTTLVFPGPDMFVEHLEEQKQKK